MINVGFLGAGDIAAVHAEAIGVVQEARLVAVADSIPERAKMLADKHGAATFTDLESLLHHPGLDVLYILTPPEGHARQIATAAEAGIPIMCEKPLTVTLEEADQAIAACKQAGVPLMTGLSHRFHPLAAQVKEMLHSEALGDLVAAWSHRLIHLPVSPDSWLNDPSAGGGLTLQYAMHDLDWLCWVGGDLARVSAQESRTQPELDIEDNLWVLLQFHNGGCGSIGVSWSAPYAWTERGFVGSQGNLRIIEQKRLVGRLADGRELAVDLGDDYDWFDVFVRESQDIARRVQLGWPFSVTGEDGRRALAIALAVQSAAQTGEMVLITRDQDSPEEVKR